MFFILFFLTTLKLLSSILVLNTSNLMSFYL